MVDLIALYSSGRGSCQVSDATLTSYDPNSPTMSLQRFSEAWGPPHFQEKRSRSEKAILGALGEFRGILRAALRMRNSILGMASHDLSNTKTTILGATPGAILRIDGNPRERFSFAPAFSERFFKNWGGPRAPEILLSQENDGCKTVTCTLGGGHYRLLPGREPQSMLLGCNQETP